MPTIRGILNFDDSTDTGTALLLTLPGKAEGASMKALMITRFDVAVHHVDLQTAAVHQVRIGLYMIWPDRWVPTIPPRRQIGAAVVSWPFGGNGVGRNVSEETLFIRHDATGLSFIIHGGRSNRFPQILIGSGLGLMYSTGAVAAGDGMAFTFEVDYEIVDVDEFQFQALLEESYTV